MERFIYVRNIDETFNKKRPIENTVEVNIYYQRHRERIEIDVIGEQERWRWQGVQKSVQSNRG